MEVHFTYAENAVTHILGGNVTYTDWKMVVLTKLKLQRCLGCSHMYTAKRQKGDVKTVGVDQGAAAMDECVDTGVSPLNKCGNS